MSNDILNTISSWRDKLLDISKKNRLINCRTGGKTSVVVLDYPRMESIWHTLVVDSQRMQFPWKHELLGNEEEGDTSSVMDIDSKVSDDGQIDAADARNKLADDQFDACLSVGLDETDFLTRLSDKLLGGRLQRLALNAQTSLQEQGVHTLFMAFGMLRWYESKDSDIPLHAPLLLVPVNLSRPSLDSTWELTVAEEEVIPNHCLTQMLLDSFELEFPKVGDDDLLENGEGLAQYMALVRKAISTHARWAVTDVAVLGMFTFQKIAMWQDLGDNAAQVAEHRLCKAMAGNTAQPLMNHESVPNASELDDLVLPRDTFHILEADSSQHEAIEAVKRKLDLVLDGPPGTGKSQTIANVIAECLAQGKSILFVSEKAAALEVVQRRLNSAKLGDFCLECHSHKANKKQVVAELGRCLSLEPEPYEADHQRMDELSRCRQHLNAYVRSLHRPQGVLGWTPYQVHGRLAGLSQKSLSRYSIRNPLGVDGARLQSMTEAVKRLIECSAVIEEKGNHPWRGCLPRVRSLVLEDDLRHHLGVLQSSIPQYAAAFCQLQELELLTTTPSWRDLNQAFDLANAAAAFPTVPADWFNGNPRATSRCYILLDELAKEYQQLRGKMSQYEDAAIEGEWGQWQQEFATKSMHLASLGLDSAPSIRNSVLRSHQLSQDIQSLIVLTENIKTYVDQIADRLSAPHAGRLPIHRLPKLAEVANLLSQLGKIPAPWFDQLRRQELQEIAEQGKIEANALGDERKLLDAIYLQSAFDNKVEETLMAALRYRSIFKRLLPGWRKRRKQMESLYTNTPPRSGSALLRDAERLLNYHRRRRELLDVGKGNRSDLRATEMGTVDWDAVLADLALVARIDGIVRLPDPAKLALSEGRIDQDELAVTAAALSNQWTVLSESLASFARRFAIDLVFDQGVVLVGRTIDDLDVWLEWLHQADIAVAQRMAILSDVQGVLREGMDVDAANFTSHSETFEKLKTMRDELRAVHKRVHLMGEEQAFPENEDWGGKASLARWLLGFIEEHGDRPPPPLVAAATDPSIRARISEAIEKISATRTAQMQKSWDFLCTVFPLDEEVSNGIVLTTVSVEVLLRWLSARASDVDRLAEWLAFREISASLEDLGLAELREEVVQQVIKSDEAVDAFLSRFYRMWLDAVYAEAPCLSGFRVEDHEHLIAKFRKLDQRLVAEGSSRIRSRRLEQSLGAGAHGLDAPSSSELGILLREINKKRRHLPLRQLFNRIPTLLRRLKPCMMMSPLAVSTFLDSKELRFDVVIFDEASQVRPHDAVCAIYRGDQLVVAGDQKQLPPTSFFERQIDGSDDVEEDEDDISDFESILDVCATLQLPRKRLRWHYRSRRESLIAFSNEHFYNGELVTFPSVADVDGSSGIQFEFVGNGRWQSGANGGFNAIEAKRTVDLIMEHVRTHAATSLGVITMNQRQQLLVLQELEKRRQLCPELEEFFSEKREEPFFVKNLENVQGDERDAMFLSIGYATDQTGKLAMRFGPLNAVGGERRLNVAVTRARQSLVLISSIKATDIDLSRTNATGVKLLRAYLDYAERGVVTLQSFLQDEGTHPPDSPFEVEVAKALSQAGLRVRPQVGCGRFRIDLAVVDPKRPGRYVLGIECDGATYHRSATARDRDRLRQSVLEGMGWHICRIWSTDWVRDCDKQVRRVLDAYADALPQSTEPLPSSKPSVEQPQEQHREEAQVATRSEAAKVPMYDFDSIELVPTSVIEELTQNVLQISGATEPKDLIVEIARRLGFRRTGSKITHRIQAIFRSLLRKEVLYKGDDGRLRIAKAT